MPKHRKRRIMLSIVSIVLFVVLSAQLSAVSFSVTAAGEHGELVAEEYERYRERFGEPGIPPAGGSDLCDAVAKTSGGSRRYDRGTRG